ncbi:MULTISPECIES: hypothetical protein [unclassified Burkholderia]|uniref:hypothetical protein n=1 Tax=unclassified Burkholderia TaxID=2613784 RepID=UPI0014243EA5|nr:MULTISPECIES: hypothetical protein [unclassified Burkholderia]NIE86144.1 hypothetical protein [Burkholderia sp. Tr-860]NIF64946.1 hypothetical protein [Burkholderia sp. Cy-647]NIF97212.1 hypothetical protein [Burkholderia sp. Ax-1720]
MSRVSLLSRLRPLHGPRPAFGVALLDACRADLLVASLAALAAQSAMLLSILLLGVPTRDFTTPLFHHIVLAYLVGATVIVRRLARHAFHAAVESERVRLSSTPEPHVQVDDPCPLRVLVVLHIHLHRQRFGRLVD